jgi:hypothetical protein
MLVTAVPAGAHLAEGLGLAQCRASDSKWSVGAGRVTRKSDYVKNGGATDDVAVVVDDDDDDDDKGNNNNNVP